MARSAAKIVLAAAVLYFAGKQIHADLSKAGRQEFALSGGWLVLSAVLYIGGMAFIVEFWRRTLVRMGGRMTMLEGQRAGFASELGKYVPGKALGIIIRCAMTARDEASPVIVVISTFYQTMAMMAVGSVVSLAALLAWGEASGAILALAAGLSVGFTFISLPPVFTRLVSLVALPFRKSGEALARPIGYDTLARGFALMTPGWALIGLSIAATAAGVGRPTAGAEGILVSVGSAGLSIASGFVMIFVPAGLGAREYVLTQTVAPALGVPVAALVAVVSRIINVVAEVATAGILYFGVRKARSGGK